VTRQRELEVALATELASAGRPGTVRVNARATGGLSQETWFVTIARDEQDQAAVLRLPTAASGGRAIAVQRSALEVTQGTHVPVPALIAYDDLGQNAFGCPYLLMERIRGEIPTGWNDLPPDARDALARDAIRVLVELQRVDWRKAPAGIRPPASDPAATELAFYRRRLADLGISTQGTVEVALRWMEARVPASAGPVLVHNDFRMGNFVIEGNRIAGVLDWELARIGHPLSDLTWCFIAVWDVPDVDLTGLFGRFAQATGRDLDPEAARWFLALGYLRLAYYSLAGGRAFAAGNLIDLRQAALRLEAPLRLDRLFRVISGEALV
jgi:aminoglycoside phosphotransferase (APT) family kinase protein